jgi:hypothetical protein
MSTDEQDETARRGRPRGSTSRKVNRVEINDEGVRVLVEIEGVPAVRAATIMQTVLDMTFQTSAEGKGSVIRQAGRTEQ